MSILCVWEILVTISAIADACSLDRGTEIDQAIRESLGKLDHYILEHSELPDAQLLAGIEKKKQQIRAGYQNPEAGTCDPANEAGIIQTYLYFVGQNPPAKLRRLVDDEIAAPRADPFAGFCI